MLTTARTRDGNVVRLTLRGTAESEAVEKLESALAGAHDDAITAPEGRVTVDLSELEFATSSCIKVLASWLLEANALESPYTIVFLTSTKHSWQRRSLAAMTACAPTVASIE